MGVATDWIVEPRNILEFNAVIKVIKQTKSKGLEESTFRYRSLCRMHQARSGVTRLISHALRHEPCPRTARLLFNMHLSLLHVFCCSISLTECQGCAWIKATIASDALQLYCATSHRTLSQEFGDIGSLLYRSNTSRTYMQTAQDKLLPVVTSHSH